MQTTDFDEEFQISTSMACDESGMPTKPKMSQLTIASDRARGILGKCDLDLAKFSYDDFTIHKIDITECQYEGAWIEVGLKAAPAARSSTRNNALGNSTRSAMTDVQSMSSALESGGASMTESNYRELLDKFADQKK